jgi:hypothetical protein
MIANFCFNKRNRQNNEETFFDGKLYEERYTKWRTNT